MDGLPLRSAFEPAIASRPLTRVASYEGSQRKTGEASAGQREMDEKVLEDLKALGYIGQENGDQ
jgi:hypothetical protein